MFFSKKKPAEVSTEHIGDLCVISATGHQDVEEGELVLEAAREAMRCGCKYLLIDLQGVPYLSDNALGNCIAAMVLMKKAGGNSAFLSPKKKVREFIDLLLLTKVFAIYDDRETALRRIREEDRLSKAQPGRMPED